MAQRLGQETLQKKEERLREVNGGDRLLLTINISETSLASQYYVNYLF